MIDVERPAEGGEWNQVEMLAGCSLCDYTTTISVPEFVLKDTEFLLFGMAVRALQLKFNHHNRTEHNERAEMLGRNFQI